MGWVNENVKEDDYFFGLLLNFLYCYFTKSIALILFIHSFIQVIGNIVAGSGIEDIVFQSDLSSSGSLNGILCGSHYNRSWIIHNTVSEALERMLFLRFIGEQHRGLPDGLAQICADPDLYTSSTETQYHEFACKYEAFRHSEHGLRTLLLKKALTTQAQEKYSCRTAIDQREKQSINRDAKTTGKIPSFFFL